MKRRFMRTEKPRYHLSYPKTGLSTGTSQKADFAIMPRRCNGLPPSPPAELCSIEGEAHGM